ncbi:MAG: single-stranded DNA-binding protein [Acidobacteriaceae bacterium]
MPVSPRIEVISGNADIPTLDDKSIGEAVMVQQTMFPQEVRNVTQPQRTGKAPQVSANRQTTAPQNRTAPIQPAPEPCLRNSTPNRTVLPAQQHAGVRVSGRIGRYFEVKQTPTGKSLATFSLATVEPYRDESGNWAKRTLWQRVVAWDQIAQAVSQKLRQGARVSVEGRFRTRESTDRDNNLHITTELVAGQVHFIDAVAA